MYRADKNKKSPKISEEEKQRTLNFDTEPREKVAVNLMARQMSSLTGLFMIAIVLVMAIVWKSKSVSFESLVGWRRGKESEILLEEPADDKEKEIEIVDNKVLVDPERLIVLKGELFKLDIYFSGNELSKELKFDSRNLVYIKFDKSKGVSGETIEKRLGELEISLRKDGLSNYWGSLVMKAVEEGVTTLEIGEEQIEIRVVQGFFNQSMERQASCSGYLERPYNFEGNSGAGLGEISLDWEGEANRLKYGRESRNYEFVIEIGDESNVVGNLEPGKEYYMVIANKNKCGSEVLSNEIKVRSGYGGMTRENMEDYEGLLPVAEGILP